MSNFDLSSLEQEKLDADWMEVESPIGEPLGIHLYLASQDSEEYKKKLRQQQDKHLKKKKMKMSAEEADNDNRELLVACVLKWQGVAYSGEELECNAENVRWVLKNFPFIEEQANEFVGDRANFFGSA